MFVLRGGDYGCGKRKVAPATKGLTLTDKTIIIPGHGNPISNKAELSAYRDMLIVSRDNVAKLKH